jgi:segregation and condensation protein B
MNKEDRVLDVATAPPQADSQLRLPSAASESRHEGAELAALIEALLIVAPEPPAIGELADSAGVEPAAIEAALVWLDAQEHRGWIVQRHGDRVQLATAPRFGEQVRAFLGLDREARLSAAALETLAVVAYQQPATRAEIEAVRGVDCSGVLATLHARGLIEAVARRSTLGNPNEYGTTAEFLRHFGLKSLAELPPLNDVEGEDGRKLLERATAQAEMDTP